MKKNIFLLTLVAVGTVACSNSDDPINEALPETTPESNVIDLRSAGKELPGDVSYDASNCRPEGSEQTLRSVRYVDPLPIYFMDYYAKVDWDKLEKNPSERYAAAAPAAVINDLNNLLYINNPVPNPQTAKIGSACSGFVCFNPQDELLFGRNFDGESPLVVVFDKAVNPGEHKNVMMTSLTLGQSLYGNLTEYNDRSLISGIKDISFLLRQPAAIMDGMNDAGLCLAAYQLPSFSEAEDEDSWMSTVLPRPSSIDVQRGNKQILCTTLHKKILRECETVEDVVKIFNEFDYTTLTPDINIHWFVADAHNNFRFIEIWKGNDGKYTIYTMDEEERWEYTYSPSAMIPYEYRSIENYYINREASTTFTKDYWQNQYTTKARVHNMMSHYSLVMNEEEALQCLQYGNYGIEFRGETTDWSCVYNPKKRTVMFNMRNDMSKVYSIDLNKDLK